MQPKFERPQIGLKPWYTPIRLMCDNAQRVDVGLIYMVVTNNKRVGMFYLQRQKWNTYMKTVKTYQTVNFEGSFNGLFNKIT